MGGGGGGGGGGECYDEVDNRRVEVSYPPRLCDKKKEKKKAIFWLRLPKDNDGQLDLYRKYKKQLKKKLTTYLLAKKCVVSRHDSHH